MDDSELLIDLSKPYRRENASPRRNNAMQTSERLAREAQQGQHDSLQELIVCHHALLFGFLYRLTGGDRPLAEDLTQEAFVHALRALPGYRYPRPFKPWLYAIAINCARDHYKRAATRRRADLPEPAFEQICETRPEAHPEESLLARSQAQGVAAAIRALPLQQREVLVLRYSQDLSLAEIAESLGIPVGTVKSRLSIALHRLREQVEEEAADDPRA